MQLKDSPRMWWESEEVKDKSSSAEPSQEPQQFIDVCHKLMFSVPVVVQWQITVGLDRGWTGEDAVCG